MVIYIYALSNPITKEIRYVGKTKSLKKRLNNHICYARNTKRKSRYVSNWILSLLKKDLKPIMTIIEETNTNDWPIREIYWIKHFKNLGFKLCNLTDGGESNNGYKYTDELREVRRKAKLGYVLPKDTREKISRTLSKKVICIDDNKTFDSMKDAILYSKVPRSTFHRKLHKKELINGKTYCFA